MPNHVHALVQPTGNNSLSEILHSWKSFTANEINRVTSRREELWMHESYDHIVRDWEELLNWRRYIAGNPEKARLRDTEFVLQERHILAPDEQMAQAGSMRDASGKMPELRREHLLRAKKLGFSDRQLAVANDATGTEIRAIRK
jgi:hypothetical protein